MKKTTPPKIYRLRSLPEHFSTGFLENGTQVLMGVDFPNLLMVMFDHEGKYLKALVREISQEAQIAVRAANAENGWYMYDRDWKELELWAMELGFTQGTISIQKFCLPEYELCIRDIPGIYQEILDDGGELDEDAKEHLQYWKEVNDYVLVLGQEYDIDCDGEVVST